MRYPPLRDTSLIRVVVVVLCLFLTAPLPLSYAQVKTAITSSGLNTQIGAPTTLPNGKVNYDITGGTRPSNGPNLFHSFGLFSIATNNIANFLNETGLPTTNIIGRINGGQVSNIWGTIQTTNFGAANLYLINPSGFIFGPTASLNVGGSFAASTADYLKMTDGAKFYADPVQPTTLSIAPVAAFGFTAARPLALSIQGASLQVASGQSLTVVGGDVTMTGGTLSAPSGQINLVSVGSPATPTATTGGEVSLSASGSLPAFTPIGFSGLGKLSVSENTTLTAAGTSAGTVFIQGGQLIIENGTTITSDVPPPPASGAVTISGSGVHINGTEVNITGTDVSIAGATLAAHNIDVTGKPTGGGAVMIAAGGAAGSGNVTFSQEAHIDVGGNPGGAAVIRGSNLTLDQSTIEAATTGPVNHPGTAVDIAVTGKMLLTAGSTGFSEIAASSFGAGNAGNVKIVAGSLELVGNPAANLGSNIGSRAFGTTPDAGHGGTIDVTTGSLILRDNTSIEASTFGPGTGGNVIVRTDNLEILGLKTFALMNTNSLGTGNAGDLDVQATNAVFQGGGNSFVGLSTSGQGGGNGGSLRLTGGNLEILNGAQISASVFAGTGRGGDIEVNANSVLIAGLNSPGNPAGIFSTLQFPARGRAGDIRVTGHDVTVTNGGQINSFSGSFGDSGNIQIQTDNLTVTKGAFITSTNFGAGLGGNLSVQANSVLLAGPAAAGGFTGLFAIGSWSAKSAGHITVKTGSLDVLDGAQISARTNGPGPGGNVEIVADRVLISGVDLTTGSFDGIRAGIMASTLAVNPFPALATGNAGNIHVQAGTLELRDQGTIRALSTSAGNGGNIDLTTGSLALTNGASITAASTRQGNAGEITANVSGPLKIDNGSVTAATVQGQGGSVAITASQAQLSNGALISAKTTGVGNAGTVTIQAGDLNLMNGAQITSSTSGPGQGGMVTVQAMETVSIAGQSPSGQSSGLFATTSSSGAGGQIILTTPQLNLNGGTIEANTTSSGHAGSITVNTAQLTVTNGGQFTSDTRQGSGHAGSITVQGLQGPGTSAESVSLSGANSSVSSSSEGPGNGGSIEIHAQHMQMEQSAAVAATASNTGKAGNVSVISDTLSLLGGARLTTNTSGAGNGGTITVRTTGDVTLQGLASADFTVSQGTGFVRSGLFAKTQTGGTGTGGGGGGGQAGGGKAGNAGDIVVTAKNVTLTDGAQIDNSTQSAGAGGKVSVTATDTITVAGTGTRISSDSTRGTGSGGNLHLQAGQIEVRDGAAVSASTFGAGNAGSIDLNVAGTLRVANGGSISTSTSGDGNGGTISIQADQIVMDGAGSRITADTLHPFADLKVAVDLLHQPDSDLIVFLDNPVGTRVAMFSQVGGNGSNFTGTILDDQAAKPIAQGTAPFTGTFQPRQPLAQFVGQPASGTWTLNIRDTTPGSGTAGSLQNWSLQLGTQVFRSSDLPKTILVNASIHSSLPVNAGSLLVKGVGDAKGNGGDITLNVRSLSLQNGATVSATSSGLGHGGTVQVNASGTVTLSGANTGLVTNAESKGIGGDIALRASQVEMTKGAMVSATSAGSGSAGNIDIDAGSQFLSTNSAVTTAASLASGGNISLRATGMIRLINSQINTSVAGGPTTVGGNIFIDPQFLILQNSQIVAQAFQGQGGNINIVAGTFLADPNSVVSASSQLGVSGSVNIQAPIQNLSGALVPLRQDFLSASALLGQRCAARVADGQFSTFVVSGRDGLPREPGGILPSPVLGVEVLAQEPSASAPGILLASTSAPIQFQTFDHTCRR